MARFTSNTVAAPATTNESWKASAYLNLYLPGRDGSRKKLGAIPLRAGKPNEKTLMDWLNEDPSRVAAIISKLDIEYRAVESGEGSGFDL